MSSWSKVYVDAFYSNFVINDIIRSPLGYDNTVYVDYIDLAICCVRKAVKFNLSLTHNFAHATTARLSVHVHNRALNDYFSHKNITFVQDLGYELRNELPTKLLYPPHNKGGILVSLHPSVSPSLCPSRIPCPLCSAYNSGWIHFLFII